MRLALTHDLLGRLSDDLPSLPEQLATRNRVKLELRVGSFSIDLADDLTLGIPDDGSELAEERDDFAIGISPDVPELEPVWLDIGLLPGPAQDAPYRFQLLAR